MGLGTRFYQTVIKTVDPFVPAKMRPFWNHEAGPKTIFFWGPTGKWGLVIAGIGDLKRPAESISISQAASLCATGLIWARWSLVIIPKNYFLCSVNMFITGIQAYHLCRGIRYQQSQSVVPTGPPTKK